MTVTPKATAKSRAGAVREEEFISNGVISIGIDPGSRYTALVVRDGDTVLHATTVKREGAQEPIDYARMVVEIMVPIVRDFEERYENVVVGIEGITDPKGFSNGRRAPINPKDIVRTGVTAGGLAIALMDAIIVPPGHNGSQHLSQYPDALKGRRPAGLPGDSTGAGTRKHEQSAFDVALKAVERTKDNV